MYRKGVHNIKTYLGRGGIDAEINRRYFRLAFLNIEKNQKKKIQKSKIKTRNKIQVEISSTDKKLSQIDSEIKILQNEVNNLQNSKPVSSVSPGTKPKSFLKPGVGFKFRY